MKKLIKAQKKQAILSKAGELFMKDGFIETTIEDLAKSLRLNRSMIYYHFPSKETLLYEVLNSTFIDNMPKIKSIIRLNITAEEKLRLLIEGHVNTSTLGKGFPPRLIAQRKYLEPKLLKKYIEQRDKYENIFRDLIQQCIDDGVLPPLNVKVASLLILSMLNSIQEWYKDTGPYTVEQITDFAVNFIIDGLKSQV